MSMCEKGNDQSSLLRRELEGLHPQGFIDKRSLSGEIRHVAAEILQVRAKKNPLTAEAVRGFDRDFT